MFGIRYEYVILTIAWQPLENTCVQASGGMSPTAEVFGRTVTRFVVVFWGVRLLFHQHPVYACVMMSTATVAWCVCQSV